MSASARTPTHPIHPQFTERWSPRAFNGEAIDEATLGQLFEAARWAPSAYNAQPWRFVYGRLGTPAFQTLWDCLVPFNQDWAKHASALVAVVSAKQWVMPGKTEPQAIASHSFDTGAAWACLALQAQHLGWYTHGMGGFDAARLRSALQVPETHAIECVVAIGRRGDVAQLPEPLRAREQPNDRRPLADLVAEGRFSFKD